jgi:YD repeat-containing protein
MVGWTRTLFDGTTQQFDARGRRVVETHADGSAKQVVGVKYFPRMNKQSNAITAPAIELLQADDERIQTL